MRNKILVSFIVLIIFTLLCGCTTKRITLDQSKNNFSVYKNAIQEIANQYGLELTEVFNEYIEDPNSYQFFKLRIEPDGYIDIEMYYSGTDTEKGLETFAVEYHAGSAEPEKAFDMPLFVNLSNCISGRKITTDLCEEFLNAPESKYAAEKYGYQKLNREKIAKKYEFNFFDNWQLYYFLTKEDEGILIFSGLTQGGTNE